jgi:uncharacterized protein YndB with AHSA1/START domain
MTAQTTSGMVVRKEATVEAPIERAFRVFTEDFSTWWPPEHHIGAVEPEAVVMELRAGGRWYERAPDGTECDWGTVQEVDPPNRILFGWQLDPDFRYEPDPALASEVEVRFTAVEPGRTHVEVEHRGFEVHGERAAELRDAVDAPDGWSGLLRRFGDAAAAADAN